MTETRTKFVPKHPKRCKNPQGRHFHHEDWQAYWGGLTEQQREWLRGKATWEHMSLSAVAMEWGA